MSESPSTASAAHGAAAAPGRPAGHATLYTRLIAMMLLEFIVFGSWFATIGLVLSTNGLSTIIGLVYALAAVSAIASPMFLGALGDRFFASQKVLGVAHILGGIVLVFLPGAVSAQNGGLVLGLIFLYTLFFQPTIGLANSIVFRQLGSDDGRFPYIRVFGTLGWAIAGLGVGWMGLSGSANLFIVTAVASFVLGLYSFTLPTTPPPAKGVRFSFGDVIGAKAMPLFRHRNFAIIMLCTLLTAVSLGFYNTFASAYIGALGVSNVAGVLAIGQLSEIVFIVSIPLVLRTIGLKAGLAVGMGMWAVRFVLFAVAAGGHLTPLVVGVALHGICNDFFLVLTAMWLNQVVPAKLHAQAQNMLILVISGLGALIGSLASGEIYNATVATAPATDTGAWTTLWIVPVAIAVVTTILWLGIFRHRHGAAFEPLTVKGEDAPAAVSPAAA
ncbi:MFS transporter [Actinomycetospora sp. TBRC 11914]|uniref:MFS transporter n=1 Tax=Actinomycetospora sp. TBRC 11914 TaxID=2729387 RepID=UPI00145D4FCF|nr:MFS transporter [Actinomycetospora sp. TBRC 11914]NMO91731.1 nucleoside permease [Actinomycetospora sp. TBRC 11914]